MHPFISAEPNITPGLKRIASTGFNEVIDSFEYESFNELKQLRILKADGLIGLSRAHQDLLFRKDRDDLAGDHVDRVVDASDEDTTDWERFGFDRLFVGDDYKGSERFAYYEEYFKDKDVEIIYFPYTEGTSSTQIRELIRSYLQE